MQTPSEFVTSYALIGQKKSTNAATKLLVLGVLAGFLIGMGAMVTNTAGHALTNPSVAKIVSGLLFPFGLIMVILTGAELFTGNCLITISVLEKKVNWLGMLRNWFYVYLGNFIGSVLLAMAAAYSGPMNLNGGGVAVYTMKVAAGKCALTFGNAVVLGILHSFDDFLFIGTDHMVQNDIRVHLQTVGMQVVNCLEIFIAGSVFGFDASLLVEFAQIIQVIYTIADI